MELPSARDLRDSAARTEAIGQWREINLRLGGAGCVGWRVGVNETRGMLADRDHWAPASECEIVAYLKDVHSTTMAAQLEMLPRQALLKTFMQPFNDGWESLTQVKDHVVDSQIDGASYFVALHDYKTGDELLQHYGRVHGA